MSMRFLVVAVFVLAVSDGVRASWLDYSLKSLRSRQTQSLHDYARQPVAMVFFAPRCRWCLKQMRVLEALSEQCRVQPMAIGLNGSVRDLREVLGRSGTVFPAFMASSRLLADIGGVPATPITVVITEGEEVKAVRGFHTADDLRALLPQASCSGDRLVLQPPIHLGFRAPLMVQDKAHCAAVGLMTMGQALFKECNAGLLHQGGSLRASHKTPICVVALA